MRPNILTYLYKRAFDVGYLHDMARARLCSQIKTTTKYKIIQSIA